MNRASDQLFSGTSFAKQQYSGIAGCDGCLCVLERGARAHNCLGFIRSNDFSKNNNLGVGSLPRRICGAVNKRGSDTVSDAVANNCKANVFLRQVGRSQPGC